MENCFHMFSSTAVSSRLGLITSEAFDVARVVGCCKRFSIAAVSNFPFLASIYPSRLGVRP